MSESDVPKRNPLALSVVRWGVVFAVIVMSALAAVLVGRALGGDNSPPKEPKKAPPPLPLIRFVGDFETGNYSQWTGGAQCANTGVPSTPSQPTGTLTVESDVVGQGRFAGRFDLPNGDYANSCEVLQPRPLGVGTDDYYGLMVRLPGNWQEPSPEGWGLSLAQLNFQDIWGTPVQLIAHANYMSVVIQTGLCRSFRESSPSCTYSSGIGGNVPQMIAAHAPLALNVWHEFIIHVHWATDKTGVVEVWHRLRLHRIWYKTVSWSQRPTIQWDARGPAAIAADSGLTIDKIGGYRGYAAFPITIWLDGFVRASSFSAAAARLP